MVVSSVSPDRWLITAPQPASLAMVRALKVSVNVPIWLGLSKTEVAEASPIPFFIRFILVTRRSSPTSCTLPPKRCLNSVQPDQSSSSNPSSILIIGYSFDQESYKSISSSADNDLPSRARSYWFVSDLNSSEAATSSAKKTSSPAEYPALFIDSSTISIASRFDANVGANPPSSPTLRP